MAIDLMAHEQTIIDQLHKSDFTFYLGGSRRMAQRCKEEMPRGPCVMVNSTTDWDFYATRSDAIINWLLSHNFKHVATRYGDMSGGSDCGYGYLDLWATDIFVNGNTQVVLRLDANQYKAVFETIPVHFYYQYLWKSGPYTPNQGQIRDILNLMFRTYESAQRAVNRVWQEQESTKRRPKGGTLLC